MRGASRWQTGLWGDKHDSIEEAVTSFALAK
jgi:hypothetical protein